MLRFRPLPVFRLAAVGFMGLVSAARAVSYLTSAPFFEPRMFILTGPVIEPPLHSVPWLVAALLAWATMFRWRVEPLAVGAFVGLNTLWAASLLVSATRFGFVDAWPSFISYLSTAVFVALLFRMIDPIDADAMSVRQGNGVPG